MPDSEWYELHLGNCLDIMPTLPAGSVDMVLADPPYGTTACKWDSVLPFEPMWAGIRRVAKTQAAIVITSSQPFTSALVMSNPKMFKQALVWDKGKGSNPLLAKKRIMQAHEDICVFCKGGLPYYPQMSDGSPYKAPRTGGNRTNRITGTTKDAKGFRQADNSGFRYPMSVLRYAIHCGSKLHPTQKSVALMEYLVRTYTNEGDTVLDFTMGSGTTGVACMNAGRNFIGIELDPGYFEIAKRRVGTAHL